MMDVSANGVTDRILYCGSQALTALFSQVSADVQTESNRRALPTINELEPRFSLNYA